MTLVRKADHAPAEEVGFRHLWGQAKPAELTATAETEPGELYEGVQPVLPLGLPFVRTAVSEDWFDWPALPELFPVSFPGVQTKRDSFLIDADLDRLKARVAAYFDPALAHEEIARRYPAAMKSSSGFVVHDAREVRNALLARGGPIDGGFVRFVYRPFDHRWIYWDEGRGLLGRPSSDFVSRVAEGSNLIEARERETTEDFSRGTLIRGLADNFGNGFSSFFPAWLRDEGLGSSDNGMQRRANLSRSGQRYLDCLGRRRRRPLLPRPRYHPRFRLPRGKRRGAPHGVATHTGAGLA